MREAALGKADSGFTEILWAGQYGWNATKASLFFHLVTFSGTG